MHIFAKLLLLALSLLLSACVTQNYQGNDQPVIERDVSNDEIAMTRISLALAHLRNGNTTQAKLNLELAKKYSPDLVNVHTGFAHFYEKVGEMALAESAYQTALSIQKDDADTLNNFGVFLCRQNKLAQAEEVFLRAIDVPSYIRVGESYENLAYCHIKVKQFDKAEEYLKKAILHSPNDVSSLILMAQIQFAKSEYSDAAKTMKRYEQVTRKFSPRAIALSYKIHQSLGDSRKAQEYIAMLINMFPSSREAQSYYANDLTDTDADRFKEDYQAQKSSLTTNQNGKKVVKLSADKRARIMTLPASSTSQDIITQDLKPITNNAKEAQDTKQEGVLEAPKQIKSQIEITRDEQKIATMPVHVVQYGETMFLISKKYNIAMRYLKKWNHINDANDLQVGKVVYLADPQKLAKSE